MQNLVSGQRATQEKSKEIIARPQLRDRMEIAGDTIRIDAMGCRREIATKIREKGTHYVLSVKENQKGTYDAIKACFQDIQEIWTRETLPTDGWHREIEQDHKRIERREVWTAEELSWMTCKERGKGLKSIIQYRCTRTEGDTSTTENW